MSLLQEIYIDYNYNVNNKQHIYNLQLTSNLSLICNYNVTNKQDTYSIIITLSLKCNMNNTYK
jgi:hypothetical protein